MTDVAEVKEVKARRRCIEAASEASLHRLSAQQRMDAEGWEKHLRAGHLPYKRDCHICVEEVNKPRYYGGNGDGP